MANVTLLSHVDKRYIPAWAAYVGLCLLFAVMLTPQNAVFAQDIPETYTLVAENDLFQLHIDSTTLAFKLLDKRSGYVWNSGIDAPLEDDRLNTSWRAFALSGISIEYFDERAVNRRVSIANSEHTLNINAIENGVSALVTFTEFEITVGVNIQLENEGIRVEIPADSIQESGSRYRLGRVYLYPFLGAARGSTLPGYMVIPDGTGSLIPFADSTRAENMFYGRYYGPDYGMTAYQPYDPYVSTPLPISYPVFGIVHSDAQSAFLAVIEDGAAYAELQVHPAEIITNFNFLYNAFIYNETYFQATNRSGAGVTIVQRRTNNFNAVVHYRFTAGEDANYIGLARNYQQYLVDHGDLNPSHDTNPNMGIRIEFLGGDKEKIVFWDRFIAMTTVAQMRDILDQLQIPNPEVIYYGWQPFGATTMPPTSLTLEGALGSVSDLQNLADTLAGNGGRLSMYLNPIAALWNEGGYSERSDLAMAITNVNIEGYHRWFGNYFFTLDAMRWRYESLANDVAAHPNIGLAIDGISANLFSDFRQSTRLDRQATIPAYQGLLTEAPTRLGMYRPNDYLFGAAQAYYDMPMGDNSYIYTAQSVPFLPTVLAGYIPYYGTPMNFSSNRQDDLLRQVEFGIYPSYYVTHEPTANMINTPSGWIYTSSYEQWGDQIRETYAWMNALLAPVRGQQIVAHEQIATDVYATTYSSGQQIVVNYTNQPVEIAGITIEGKDAALLESRP